MTITLADLCGGNPRDLRVPSREPGCAECAPGDDAVYDGDDAICHDCGAACVWSVDGYDDAYTSEPYGRLTPEALAELRALLASRGTP